MNTITYNVTGTQMLQLEFDFLKGNIGVNQLSHFLNINIKGWVNNKIRICNMYDPNEFWEFDFFMQTAFYSPGETGKKYRRVSWKTSSKDEALMIFLQNINNNEAYHMARLRQAIYDGAYINADTLDLVYRVPGWTEEYMQFYDNGIAITN